VTILSPTIAWACGHEFVNGAGITLIEHWDGTAWSSVPGAPIGLRRCFGLVALSDPHYTKRAAIPATP
jgi:hypothetical protein